MTPLKNLAFVTNEVNPLDVMAIKNKDTGALLRNIQIASYFGGTDFKLVTDLAQKASLIKSCEFINFSISNGEIVYEGYSGIFDKQYRKKGINTYVILSDIKKDDSVIGYVVAYEDKSGVHINSIKLADALNLCKKYLEHDFRAFQNGIYVSATSDKRDFIRSHTKEFMSTSIKVNRTKPVAVENNKDDIKKAETLDKSSPFTKEQLMVLKKYKDLGLPISKVANPKLSAEQMDVLMQIEKAGADCSYFADPKASIDTLRYYLADAVSGSAKDIENYVYLDLSPEQLVEVSLGYYSGVDYPQYADKLIPATEMAEIRMRLESGLWHDAIIPADDMFSAKLRYEKSKLGKNSEGVNKIDNELNKINSLKGKYRA